jgi:hypothetical protein
MDEVKERGGIALFAFSLPLGPYQIIYKNSIYRGGV